MAQHAYSCGSRYYSCIDCGEDFDTESIKAHNSCISEAQKHQGSMYKGPKVGAKPAAPAAPVLMANGKRARHALDSTDDEEEEEAAEAAAAAAKAKAAASAAKPAKKAKSDAAAPAAAAPAAAAASSAPAAAAAAPAAFDALTCLRDVLSKKGGSVSLKKLRKAVVKAAAESAGKEDKAAATKQLLDALLDNASNVHISWSDKSE